LEPVPAVFYRPDASAGHDRLDSWKEIASYLGRQVRTVQLWEQWEELPVRRHVHKKLGTVYAFKSELDTWRSKRSSDGGTKRPPLPVPTDRGKFCGGVKLAVLPFENLSGYPDQEYFCAGLAEEIVTGLGCLNREQLRIVCWDSGKCPKKFWNARDEVDGEMAADHVLEGSVRRERGRARISVRVWQLNDQTVLWSDSYDCEVENILAVQTEVATKIGRSLFLELLPTQKPLKQNVSTTSLDAYDAYLKGRHFWNQRTRESVRMAILHFQTAIQKDPRYALAYSGLADCYNVMSFYEILPPTTGMPKARAAANRALELDAAAGEAHASLADVLMHFDWDWPAAEREYKIAMSLNPECAKIYHWYANYLGFMGRDQEAVAAINRAEVLDPTSLPINVWKGVILHYIHDYPNAVAQYRKALELNPYFVWGHAFLGLAHEQAGQMKDAIFEFRKANALAGESATIKAMLGHAYAVCGDKGRALGIIKQLKSTKEAGHLPLYDIAALYTALAETNDAIDCLYKAYKERNLRMGGLKRDPRFERLHSNPRFRELERRVGLA
jgi:TolB-like protein/Flp pilus assembly protein TadD